MEENNNSTSTSSGGSKKGLIIAVVAVIVILAIAAGGFAFMNMNKTSDTQDSAAVESAETQANVSPEAMSEDEVAEAGSDYKDGTYEATGTYSYHSGTESIKVSVTLQDGKVEEVTVTTLAKAPTSKAMQADFAANFEPMVVGKNIDELKLGKVSGSSLTPIGFNAAIEDIKSQAQQS